MADLSGLIGTVIAGKYTVDRVIGRGGMGTVLRAMHADLRKPVAIKVLHIEALHDREATMRFVREARASAHIASDHVARVYDVGRLDTGAPYMVMEFLEGRDVLAELHDRGPLDVELATEIVLQATEAVAHAHSIGVIHRDLKPANLFLVPQRDGSVMVKVLDFGISRAKEESEARITQSSSMLGSPQYMAPEQIRNPRLADERADIWSLGIILYELLTASQPFVGVTPSGVLAAIVADPHVPVLERNPEIPPELAQVVDRCLVKDPAGRYQSVAALATALARFAPDSGSGRSARIASILNSPPSELPPLSPSELGDGLSDDLLESPRTPGQGGRPSTPPAPTLDDWMRSSSGSASGVRGDTLKDGASLRLSGVAGGTLRSDVPLEVARPTNRAGSFWTPLVLMFAALAVAGYLHFSRGSGAPKGPEPSEAATRPAVPGETAARSGEPTEPPNSAKPPLNRALPDASAKTPAPTESNPKARHPSDAPKGPAELPNAKTAQPISRTVPGGETETTAAKPAASRQAASAPDAAAAPPAALSTGTSGSTPSRGSLPPEDAEWNGPSDVSDEDDPLASRH